MSDALALGQTNSGSQYQLLHNGIPTSPIDSMCMKMPEIPAGYNFIYLSAYIPSFCMVIPLFPISLMPSASNRKSVIGANGVTYSYQLRLEYSDANGTYVMIDPGLTNAWITIIALKL